MHPPLLKLDPTADDPSEQDYDLAYYRGLTTAERFRMIVERSILLIRLANRHATDRESPATLKRV